MSCNGVDVMSCNTIPWTTFAFSSDVLESLRFNIPVLIVIITSKPYKEHICFNVDFRTTFCVSA